MSLLFLRVSLSVCLGSYLIRQHPVHAGYITYIYARPGAGDPHTHSLYQHFISAPYCNALVFSIYQI